MPAVTVVVPTFDQCSFLPRALSCLVDQHEHDWEAVLVDDGSADATHDVIEPWLDDPRFTYLRHDRNRGLGAALNAGIDRARSPLVAYLPSDDVWDADHLSTLLAALADGSVVMAWSGVRRGGAVSTGPPVGFPLQLVQVCHRRTTLRWPLRSELESDDLDLLFWQHLRAGRTVATGRVTCEWTDHPLQRHKAIRESYDGGLNVFRSRYRVREPLRFHSSDSGTVDEVALYRQFRERPYPAAPDGMRILLAGELAFNPERVLALAERGHRLYGLWTRDGLGSNTVGPLPFGHVEDLPQDDWPDAVRRLAPDVIYAQLNWRAVRFAHELMRRAPQTPFLWHFKESPQRSIVRGEWPLLTQLITESDGCLVATEEERAWFELAVPQLRDAHHVGVMDGDLPKVDWLTDDRSPKLSEQDGEPHTVVLGRPVGLDLDLLLWLTSNRVHIHLHGLVDAPGPSGAWRAWLGRLHREAPERVHVHDAVPPDRWVRDLSRYDAGWLHQSRSANHGDLRAASWDDLNTPARLPVLLGAGLPLILRANPGHTVAVERIVGETSAGLLYGEPEELLERLRSEVATSRAGRSAWAVRETFTFDHHAEPLLSRLHSLAIR